MIFMLVEQSSAIVSLVRVPPLFSVLVNDVSNVINIILSNLCQESPKFNKLLVLKITLEVFDLNAIVWRCSLKILC